MSTPHQLAEGNRRLALVQALGRFPSLKKAAAELGEPIANLSRYRAAYDGTLDSLLPKTDQAGRPRLAAVLSDEEIAFAKSRYLMTESLPLAVEALADSPVCSEGTRRFLNHYRETRDYPPSLYQAMRITAEQWASYRGQKQSQGVAYTTRRGMFYVNPEGVRCEVLSGDIIEQDDVSVDCPYYVQLPDGSFRVGRQVLIARDVRSGAYRGACAVARERDSYRAEDIVRFNKWLVESMGLPGRFRFERGSWASDMIEGLKLPDGRRWGGLAQLVPIDHCYSSNGKGGIESSFRMWHKILGLHGVRIGKTRGEYEQPTADMLAVNEGRKHPEACGFIAWEKLRAVFDAAGKQYNSRSHYDRHSGEHLAPDDIWWRDMQARKGKRLPVCPAEFGYHFLPVKRIVGVGTTHAGHVSVSVDGYRQPFMFRCAGLDAKGEAFPYLERKHQVIVCFDPHEAARGAEIFNIDSSARNREGYRPLQHLFTAPLGEDRPQYNLSADQAADADVAAKKIRHAQVKASFTSIGVFGQGARHVQHTHNGDGATARLESGAAPASRMAQPAAGSARSALSSPLSARRAKPAPIVIEEDLTTGPGELMPAFVSSRAAAPREAAAHRSLPCAAVAVEFEDLDLR